MRLPSGSSPYHYPPHYLDQLPLYRQEPGSRWNRHGHPHKNGLEHLCVSSGDTHQF